MHKGLDFGLDWSFETKKTKILPSLTQNLMPKTPFGFNLGIIGDLIRHNGESYLSLTSLVSALQQDSDVKIVLNQKVIAQDNKPSKIFVGDNLPFTGSTISTTGQAQQTTANIDYKDVGVSLLITPLIGDDNMITLNIVEEISEALSHHSDYQLSGIQTTKTNMSTSAHVPNAHFLVLSGMARNSKTQRTSGVPCLGGLPYIGSLFNRTEEKEEKRSILIFVRPQLVDASHFTKYAPKAN
jgi:type III secretion protein C